MKPLNLIALLLFLAALVGVLLLPDHAQVRAQGRFLKIVAPLMRGGSEAERNLKSTIEDLDSRLDLEERNRELEGRVEELPLLIEERDRLREENQGLRISLGFVEEGGMELVAARVIQRDTSTWWRTVIIDRGAKDGIRTDQAVRSPAGVVGKVTVVEDNISIVLLMTDEMCRVPAMVADAGTPGAREYGIVQGWRGGIQDRPELRMIQLPREPKAEIGAQVYTSGEGGIFPSGIPVGRIQSVENGDLVGEAMLRPEVNFMDLDYIFVIRTPAPAEPES